MEGQRARIANVGAMGNGFLGFYRAMVVDDVDPQLLGRVRVEVPAVLGSGQTIWAMPCVPYLEPDLNIAMIPPVGTGIWVTFEGGEPNQPVWVGRFFSPGEGPGPRG